MLKNSQINIQKDWHFFYEGEYERELMKFIVVVAKIFLHHLEKKNFIGQEYLKVLPKHMLLVHKNAYQFVSVICLCAMHLLFRV